MEAAQGMYIPCEFNFSKNKDSKGFTCSITFGHEDKDKNPKKTERLCCDGIAATKKDAKKVASENMLEIVKLKYGNWRQVKQNCKEERQSQSMSERSSSDSRRRRPPIKILDKSVEAELAPPGYDGNGIVFVRSYEPEWEDETSV